MIGLAQRRPPSMRDPWRVLALSGSLRAASLNRRLLAAAEELAAPDPEIAIDDGPASLPLFDEDLEGATAGGPLAVRAFRRRVASADGLLIATPEYNGSIPGGLQNAIDWLSRDDPEVGLVLEDKPAAITGATPGAWGTRDAQRVLRDVLTTTDSLVLPRPALYLRHAGRRFDDAGRLVDAATRGRLAALLAAFAEWIERHAARPCDVHD